MRAVIARCHCVDHESGLHESSGQYLLARRPRDASVLKYSVRECGVVLVQALKRETALNK
jgi:hypothetical protein